MLGDGRLAVVHGQGGARLSILDPETCELTELDTPLPEFSYSVSAAGMVIAGVAGGPLQPTSVVRIDAATGKSDILRQELDELPDIDYLPVPRPGSWRAPTGGWCTRWCTRRPARTRPAPPGELPPYVVWVHGGPTAAVSPLLDLEKAYFTSRGIGVVDVNYGGSTGYGRSYRERLRRQWGVVDVEDAIGRRPHAGRGGRGRPEAAGHPGRVGGRLDGPGRGDHRHRRVRAGVQRRDLLLRRR